MEPLFVDSPYSGHKKNLHIKDTFKGGCSIEVMYLEPSKLSNQDILPNRSSCTCYKLYCDFPLPSTPLVSPEDISSDSDGYAEEGVAIRSPIRVTPERDRSRKRHRHDHDKERAQSSKLSVKDRLFVSKKSIIGEGT